ncbi:MAG: undecaprenyl-diphosphate phosphatase [Proteobacteria bacterium]|nr:undecaprenyl-diphosphate phosphatase [Pseudomonadota bacterium]
MEIYQAITLGIVQGLTEFLPISSSGHLVIVQNLFGLKEAELVFDVCLHVGTILAVLFYFRRDLAAMISALVRVGAKYLKKEISLSDAWKDQQIKMAILIIVGTLPTMVIGLAFKQIAETLFSSVRLVGAALMVTGLILWMTRKILAREPAMDSFSLKKGLIIGVIQGLSITPGISRSGSTIAAGLFLGLDRELAARFSFLLSIPAICGAAILSLKDINGTGGQDVVVLLSGMLVACLSGYLSLSFLVYIVKKGRLFVFAPYCWLVGMAAIAATFFMNGQMS